MYFLLLKSDLALNFEPFTINQWKIKSHETETVSRVNGYTKARMADNGIYQEFVPLLIILGS